MARHSAGGRADLQELPVAIHRDVETEDYTVMLHWNAEDGSTDNVQVQGMTVAIIYAICMLYNKVSWFHICTMIGKVPCLLQCLQGPLTNEQNQFEEEFGTPSALGCCLHQT